MTAPPAEPFAHEDFYRSARPIRRFVAGILVVAAAMLVVWWSGLITPRVTAELSEGVHDFASGGGTLRIDLRNDALLGIELREVTLDVAIVQSAQLDGKPLAARPHLPGGSTAELVIEYEGRGRCLPVGATGAALVVRVETSAGFMRSDRSWLSVAGSC